MEKKTRDQANRLKAIMADHPLRPWIPPYFLSSEYRKIGFFILLLLLLCVIFFTLNGFIFSDKTIPGTDFFPSSYFSHQHFMDFFKKTGHPPQWDPYLLGGLPTMEAMHVPPLEIFSYIKFLIPLHRMDGWRGLFYFFLTGLGMFLFLKKIGVTKRIALVAAVAYMFAPLNGSLAYSGHLPKMFSAAMLPFMLYFFERGLDRQSWVDFLWLALCIGLAVTNGHFQLFFFGMMFLGIYALLKLYWKFKQEKNWSVIIRSGLYFTGASLIGILIGSAQLYPPYIYSKIASPRTGGVAYEFAASWSMHPEEIVSFIVPEFVNHLDFYWGQNPFKINSEYSGIILSVFFLFLSFFKRSKEFYFFSLTGLIVLMVTLGAHTPLHKLLYLYVPFMNLLRAPGLMTYIFTFSLITLGALGAHFFFKEIEKIPEKEKIKYQMSIKYFLIGIVFVAVLWTFTAKGFFEIWKSLFFPAISQDKYQTLLRNIPKFIQGLWIMIILSAATALLILLRIQKKIKFDYFVLGLLGLVLIDCWRINFQFYHLVNLEDILYEDQAVRELKKDHEPYRVFPLPGSYQHPNYLALFGIESVTGFHDNELRWYREFRGKNNENLIYRLQQNKIEDNPILNLLNVKYLIYRDPNSRRNAIIYNSGYLPRAFLVPQFVISPLDSTLQIIKSSDFNYRTTVILNESPEQKNVLDSSTSIGQARIEYYDGDRYQIQTTLSRPGFLVMSTNYYPEWHARIDNHPQKLYRANYTQMALPLEAGEHRIDLVYRSKAVSIGFRLSFLTSLILSLVLGTYYVRQWKKSRKRRDGLCDK